MSFCGIQISELKKYNVKMTSAYLCNLRVNETCPIRCVLFYRNISKFKTTF